METGCAWKPHSKLVYSAEHSVIQSDCYVLCLILGFFVVVYIFSLAFFNAFFFIYLFIQIKDKIRFSDFHSWWFCPFSIRFLLRNSDLSVSQAGLEKEMWNSGQ